MLDYFSSKKTKKRPSEVKAQTPLLNDEDVNFLQRMVSAEGTPPPLPQRPQADQMVVHEGNGTVDEQQKPKDKGKGKENEKHQEKEAKKSNRFSFLHRSSTKKNKNGLEPAPVVTPNEATKEEDDINRVLEDLNLAAVNNRAFSLSKESQQLVQKFTVILKDLVNGVPTAYDDLVGLIEDSQGTLAKSYDHLPKFLQELITKLPNKLTGNLAPELLAVAAEAQALNAAGSGSAGLMGGVKNFLKPTSLKDLVAKPGAVVSLLKTIMNALKLRWPAFMGTNVLLSLALFVLLFVFWYCHKRGREVRLEREAKLDSEGRIVELPDDPQIAAGAVPVPAPAPAPGALAPTDQSGGEHSERPRSARSNADEQGRRPKSSDRRQK